jgi:hypothetical protein
MAAPQTVEHFEWYAEGLRFTCTQCGNCCTGPSGYVWFDQAELTAMAEYLGISEEQFIDRHTRRRGRRLSLTECKTRFGYDCVFLERDASGRTGCSIYPVRPKQCRTWPFWPENLESPENYLHAADRCPGMHHGLKGEGRFYPVEQIRIIRDDSGS